VLVVQNNAFNESNIRTIVVVPLTTNLRLVEAPGNVFMQSEESKLTKDSVIIVAQLYALDRDRFIEKISKINKDLMVKVENGMMLVLGMK
jgi:mRNA interferase MazF